MAPRCTISLGARYGILRPIVPPPPIGLLSRPPTISDMTISGMRMRSTFVCVVWRIAFHLFYHPSNHRGSTVDYEFLQLLIALGIYAPHIGFKA
eukprot:8338874-Pyramimonas_sp.AAC.1